ncbi:S-adenosyl-L-methionine-dependent methyltransferase [Coniella lustricola]|uniref:S-adenosyl-L-methionine-dependent methyltransferase n=1 Tax=Coniella lustricola TaxID=2025994 RepID=A0A2T3AKH2_9PEZI|nr:S-adenosyl-L-methionine-dependent methyltransferase [Coniella lustricola]
MDNSSAEAVNSNASSASLFDGGAPSYITADGEEFPVKYMIGRRFQTFKNSYAMPIDDKEAQREYFLHLAFKEFLNEQLYLAPVGDSKRIVDVGCGFGYFAEEIAQRQPDAEVIGIDMTPRDHQFVPDNLSYLQADIEASSSDGSMQPAWNHASIQQADLIFVREMTWAMVDPVRVIENAKRTLKPGGWIEFQQGTGTKYVDPGPDYPPYTDVALRWESLLEKTMAAICPHSDPRLASKLKSMLQQAGFANVTEQVIMVPIGDWPKKRRLRNAGVCIRETFLGIRDAFEVMVQHTGAVSIQDFTTLHEQFRAQLFDREVHMYAPYSIVFGQKPVEEEEIVGEEVNEDAVLKSEEHVKCEETAENGEDRETAAQVSGNGRG